MKLYLWMIKIIAASPLLIGALRWMTGSKEGTDNRTLEDILAEAQGKVDDDRVRREPAVFKPEKPH
jgi:hypothetical protein